MITYTSVRPHSHPLANYGTALGRPVYAIDPISYDIAKIICEGLKANVEQGWVKQELLHLYHAAAGPQYDPSITITRPSDEIGKFDQASLSREAVDHEHVVKERIPMITVDSIIPDNVTVGVVKTDVQGHEYDVLMGMGKLLSRKIGYPAHVFYEDHHGVTGKAGFTPGACALLLQSHGYSCSSQGGDVLCSKF